MPALLPRAALAAHLATLACAASGCERPLEGAAARPVLAIVSGIRETARAVVEAAPLASAPPASASAPSAADPTPPDPPSMTLIAGGDVSFGRMIGQLLLREPERDLFATIAPLLASADVRFCNLESQLSDQGGRTVHPLNNLVFTGPPAGADALARAGFTLVSTANNHAWDFGKKALFETMDNLDRVGVRYVGTGKNREAAYRHVIVEHKGFRLAVLAVTDIWNQGSLWKHQAKEFVAGADEETLPVVVRALRADPNIDAVALSYHGLAEYQDEPLPRTREILRSVIDAGADVVIGHHPHVIHGVEWRSGRPILYSLGNLLMRMNSFRPWTEMGYLARLRLTKGQPPRVEACPFRMFGIAPTRFVGDPSREAYERRFFGHLSAISKTVGGTAVGATGEDGCAVLSPPEPPAAPATPKKKK